MFILKVSWSCRFLYPKVFDEHVKIYIEKESKREEIIATSSKKIYKFPDNKGKKGSSDEKKLRKRFENKENVSWKMCEERAKWRWRRNEGEKQKLFRFFSLTQWFRFFE